MRSAPRPRREVPGPVLAGLTPLFRYSPGRDAYVLRGVGHHVGPVIRARRHTTPARFVKDRDHSAA
jgi:hypothetical protein